MSSFPMDESIPTVTSHPETPVSLPPPEAALEAHPTPPYFQNLINSLEATRPPGFAGDRWDPNTATTIVVTPDPGGQTTYEATHCPSGAPYQILVRLTTGRLALAELWRANVDFPPGAPPQASPLEKLTSIQQNPDDPNDTLVWSASPRVSALDSRRHLESEIADLVRPSTP